MNPAKVTPSDIVASLMFYTGTRFILADPHKLHNAVFVAKKVCPLLDTFQFSARGVSPISRSFDEALGIVKLSRIIRMENTDYERYIIDNEARQYVASEVLPRFTSDEKESLARAAAIIREVCGGADPVPVEACEAAAVNG